MYGDWLSIGESTPNDVLDTAFCVYSSGSVFEWIYRYALGMEWGEGDAGLQHMTL